MAAAQETAAPLRPMANPAVIYRLTDDGQAVLVNTDTTNALVLNATGMLVWRWADGQHSLEEMAHKLREQYGDAVGDVLQDVRELVAVLAEEGFVGYEWGEKA